MGILNLRISPDLEEKIESLVATSKHSKSDVVRAAIERGLSHDFDNKMQEELAFFTEKMKEEIAIDIRDFHQRMALDVKRNQAILEVLLEEIAVISGILDAFAKRDIPPEIRGTEYKAKMQSYISGIKSELRGMVSKKMKEMEG